MNNELTLPGYRYHETLNGKSHVHLLGDKPLIGTSGVTKILDVPTSWWASGLAVRVLGTTDPKVITKIKNNTATQEEKDEMMKSVATKLEEIKALDTVGYYNLLDSA